MDHTAGKVISFPSDIDPIRPSDLQALLGSDHPRVTIQFATHRHGPEVRQGPVRLRALGDAARSALSTQVSDAALVERIMAPVEALADDEAFWQHQASGLSIFAAPGLMRAHRVATELPEMVMVGDSFHLTPLTPLLSGDGEFLVLVVSQNLIKVFGADRWHIWEIDTSHASGALPTSMNEALAYEDHERQLQQHSSGSGEARFHGHGSGDELDKAMIERFLRAVDHGLSEVLAGIPGAAQLPLVVASVGYYQPILRSIGRHRRILDPGVEGNPDRLTPAELHAAAWAVAAPHFAQEATAAVERWTQALGTGLALTEPFEIAAAATEGRVDTLIVDPSGEFTAAAIVDSAIIESLSHAGRILTAEVPGSLGAILRY